MRTTELPRLYGPQFRKLLLPVAFVLLAIWILLLGTNIPAPGWFQAFVVITWIGSREVTPQLMGQEIFSDRLWPSRDNY